MRCGPTLAKRGLEQGTHVTRGSDRALELQFDAGALGDLGHVADFVDGDVAA